MENLRLGAEELEEPLVWRLGEAGYGPTTGIVGRLHMLARAGLPVPQGLVVSCRAHQLFLDNSGLLEVLRAYAPGRSRDCRTYQGTLDQRASYLRRTYQAVPISEELNRELCEALIGLGARSVRVLGKDFERGGLESIPEVRDALREAWLSPEGLRDQLEAVSRGQKFPTWPVLIQREVFS